MADRSRGEEERRELALFERAAQLYEELGDVRGHAEALFWIGQEFATASGAHGVRRQVEEARAQL